MAAIIENIWIKVLYSWSVFLSVLIDPFVIVAIMALVFLYTLSNTDKNSLVITFTLITAASTILGVRITQKWSEVTDGGVVTVRGKSAVRSLKLLFRNITSLEKRVASFVENEDDIKNHPEVTFRNYEEIRETCSVLQEETVSSIENWTDIVPEADIKSLIGEITELRSSLQESKQELRKMDIALNNIKDESEQDKSELLESMSAKEAEISRLNNKLLFKSFDLGVGSDINVGAFNSLMTYTKAGDNDTLSALGAIRINLDEKID